VLAPGREPLSRKAGLTIVDDWMHFIPDICITDTILNLFFGNNEFTNIIINDTDPTKKQHFVKKRYVDNNLKT